MKIWCGRKSAERAQGSAQRAMVWHSAGNKSPKLWRVVKLRQVAEFVDDDIVAQRLRQERYFITKVEIPARRTASPSRLGIAYKNFFVRVAVDLIVISQPRMQEPPRPLAMFVVVGSSAKVHYFIRTPLNALPLCDIWSINLPVLLLILVKRLLRPEKTCERLLTVPVRPLPFGPFFAISKWYHSFARPEHRGRIATRRPRARARPPLSIGHGKAPQTAGD